MEKQIRKNNIKKGSDTYSYKGWLNSDSFFKRAFSILGYMFVAQLIIQIPIMVIFFIIMMIMMMTMGIAGLSEWGIMR